MAWWSRKVVFPVKRAWDSVAGRNRAAAKHYDGFSRLHDDVQVCEYQDVQVMWEMLRQSEMQITTPRKQRKRPFWRSSASSRRTSSSSNSGERGSPASAASLSE